MQLIHLLATSTLWIVGVPALFACGYLLLLTLISISTKPRKLKSQTLFFDIIVPAHNESAVIQRTVTSLQAIDWPKDRYRILVIADNCTDDTAKIATNAGANVIERFNDQQRGKGYALNHAFQHSRNDGRAIAVVVVDADTEVSENFLTAIATRVESGAEAVQVHYGVLNPMTSWRTRLITIAKGSFHILRSRARERLHLSCGIRGNGWCVTHKLLERVPFNAFSVTEDIEYGINLGLAGVRVHYADEAHADGEMVSNEQIASKQRQRWEGGRFQLIRTKTLPLLKMAFTKPSLVCLDLGVDLLVLPLSYIAVNAVFFVVLASVATWWSHLLINWLWLSLACIISLALYVLRGWQLSGVGMQGLLDLMRAPGFILWKLLLMLRKREPASWVRTDRERH
jgi:1,2-diacylglycerol 3-beta-glucosyltransferase